MTSEPPPLEVVDHNGKFIENENGEKDGVAMRTIMEVEEVLEKTVTSGPPPLKVVDHSGKINDVENGEKLDLAPPCLSPEDPSMRTPTKVEEVLTNVTNEEFQSLVKKESTKRGLQLANRAASCDGSLPHDIYSFFINSEVCSGAFWFAFTIFLIQCSIFGLLLADVMDPFTIPVNVETSVRIAQGISLLVAVLNQDDLLTALADVLQGYDQDNLEHAFPNASYSKWLFALVSKTLQGMLGLLSAFTLIVIQDDTFELILTFAGVEFVYHLDEVSFYIAKAGFFGRRNKDAAKEISEKTWDSQGKNFGRFYRYKHAFGFLFCGAALFSGWGVLMSQQKSNEYLCHQLQIEISDEQLASLGPLNGLYGLVPATSNNARVTYEQIGQGSGKLGFCKNGGLKAWTMTSIASDSHTPSPCENWLIRSSDTSTFDAEATRSIPWQLQGGRQLEFLRLSCYEGSVMTDCQDGFYGIDCEFSSLCSFITIDSSTSGFPGMSSPNFAFLESETNPDQSLQKHYRPVYINDDYDYVMVFQGLRWVLGSTTRLQSEYNISLSAIVEGESEFTNEDWIEYVSEPVDLNVDTGTPIGLLWYKARISSSGDFLGPLLDQRVDATFRCGVCNSETNPCLNEGQCSEEGTCICKHGARGAFCDIPPLDDGVCQDYFNTEAHGYDGGDCCASTCKGIHCGEAAMNTLFGYRLEAPIKGFPNCKDPRMVPMHIEMDASVMPIYGSTVFFSTWEIYCGGVEYLYSPSFGCNEFGTCIDFECSTAFGIQTIFVEPRVSCQVVAKTKFTFFDPTVISVYRGSDNSSAVVEHDAGWADGIDFEFPVLSDCLLEELSTVSDLSKILDSTSNIGQAAAWIDVEASDESLCDNRFLIDLYALATINFSMGRTLEGNGLTWLSGNNACKWSGIFCNAAGSVEIIFLNGLESVTGSIPSETSLLTDLKVLTITGITITGSIPSDLGSLANLEELNFYGAELMTGTIPTELGLLTHLKTLSLSGNDLTGTIPTFGNLLKLQDASFNDNQLSGTIPASWGPELALLFLQNNALTGSLPTFASNRKLSNLAVGQNDLTGFVPQVLTSIESLEKLDIEGTNLTCYETDVVCKSLTTPTPEN